MNLPLISINYSHCDVEKIGRTNGIDTKNSEFFKEQILQIISVLKNEKTRKQIGFLRVPYDVNALKNIQKLSIDHQNRWDNVVIIGIGGSSLGVTMLFSSLCHPYHNLLSQKQRNGIPRFFILDNVDPLLSSSLIDIIDISKTLFILITKSGATIETWSIFYRFTSTFSLRKDQVIAITDPEKGYLRIFASEKGWATLSIPSDVGGRFSVLTAVGLFPASLMGIPTNELLEGARQVDEICFGTTDFERNICMKLALYYYFYLINKNKTINVMMPYSNSLYSFADWFRQLWAESLGKKTNLSGKIIYAGQTPVKALGATDQHSQVQLYREGPDDKIFTFLKIESFPKDRVLERIPHDSPWKVLEGFDLSQILNIELEATIEAISLSGRPSILITLPELNPIFIGQLIYFYEIVTWLMGENLKINPFDQPGVEAGKKFIREKIMKQTSVSD